MNEATRRGGQFVLATALSIVAYHLSFFGAFCLFSLQWVRSRFGMKSFLVSAGLTLAGIVAIQMGLNYVLGITSYAVKFLTYLAPTVLVCGWVAIVALERTGWRFLYRLLAATAFAGLMLFPMIAWLLNSKEFMGSLEEAFRGLWDKVTQGPGFADISKLLSEATFFEQFRDGIIDSFLVVFFLLWMIAGRLAKWLEPVKYRVLRDFRLPREVIWVFLLLTVLMLVQYLVNNGNGHWDLGFWQYVAFSAMGILLILHIVAGWGTLEALLERWNWPSVSRGLVRVVLVVMVPLGPGLFVLAIGLPLLAVLELWVNLRTRTQEVGQ
jgi:hypothetical protein